MTKTQAEYVRTRTPGMMNRHERRKNAKVLLKVLDVVMAKRPCDECSACCTTLEVPAVQTKVGETCRHVVAGKGCSIYAHRPKDCRDYACGWKLGLGSQDQRPDKIGFTITAARPGMALHPAWLVHELWKGAVRTPEGEELLRHMADRNIVVVMRDASAVAQLFFPEDRAEEVRRFVATNTVENSG